MTVQEIAARISERAFMAYAYSEGAYRRVASFLLAQGFTAAEAEWIMDSKHMRWAYDAGNGEATSGTFTRYFAKQERQIRADLERYADDVKQYEEEEN